MLFGCRGKPATNKHRMNTESSNFATRLRELIGNRQSAIGNSQFSELALELFALQFKCNPAYRKICEARKGTPQTVKHWPQIPAVPTAVFKELELTSLAPEERTAVFHSSGTTEQPPSRHFHCAESLAVYESSLWSWFSEYFQLPISNFHSPANGAGALEKLAIGNWQLAILTPPPEQVPHSSLVHMFETVRQKTGGAGVLASRAGFFGKLAADGAWALDFEATLAALTDGPKLKTQTQKLILGTAFSFVHLLDYLVERDLRFELPPGSRVLETGGYKNRSRTLAKAELHALIAERMGVPRENIVCEYGMSELSSQAYDSGIHPRAFRFPPWVRVQIVSPETGCEVAEGETGLIRIFDLANVFSVAAIQTEDLGIRRGEDFELVGRAQLAEPRGCSLMNA